MKNFKQWNWLNQIFFFFFFFFKKNCLSEAWLVAVNGVAKSWIWLSVYNNLSENKKKGRTEGRSIRKLCEMLTLLSASHVPGTILSSLSMLTFDPQTYETDAIIKPYFTEEEIKAKRARTLTN